MRICRWCGSVDVRPCVSSCYYRCYVYMVLGIDVVVVLLVVMMGFMMYMSLCVLFVFLLWCMRW